MYSIPQTGEESWGENLTSYFTAIPQGALQKTGGNYTLTADVNFGANFGLLSKYFSTRSSLPSSAGLFRLSVNDVIGWRNNADAGDLLLGVNASDQLTFDGNAIYPGGITALTGDATANGPGSVPITFATVNANVGSFGSASSASIFTVNAKGLITAASDTPIQIAESQVTNLVADLASKQPLITIGALDAQAANATGLALVSNVLSTQSASATMPGLINNSVQVLSGAKSFSSDITLSAAQFNNTAIGAQLGHNSSTGVVSGGVLSVNGGDNTKFDLTAGTGQIIDYSVPLTPTIKNITWSAFTAQSVPGLASQDETYVMLTNLGAIALLSNFPTPTQRRSQIFIGRLGHSSRTFINFATSFPDYSQSVSSQMYDLYDALGPFNVSGNQVATNGAALSFQKTSGIIFFRAFNYPTNPNSPSYVSSPAATPQGFFYRTQTTLDSTPRTLIIPGSYDVGGTVTAVPNPGATATIQRVYLSPNGTVQIQYGQATYSNLTAAVAAIGTESFIVNPGIANTGVLIAYIAVQKNCAALNDTSTSQLLRAPRFETGVGGGVNTVVSLQQTYNSSTSPEIVLNSTQLGLQINDNSTPLGVSLFSINNNGGSTAYLDVAATGVTVTNLTNSGLTASQAVVTNGSKQLGSLPYSTTPGASTLAEWDANSNLSAKNFIEGFSTTVSSGGNLTLVVGSNNLQYITGSTTHTVTLPTTGIVAGQSYTIVNLSSGIVTVQSSGANTIQAMPANSKLIVTALIATPTTAANWDGTQAGGTASPLTTKGDLYGFSSVNARIPAGLNGQRVIADSAQTLGVRYQSDNYKNYIINKDAEVDTTGWATYADAAANRPVDGTGGAPSSTWTRTTSSPLRETASFLWTRTAANRQGEGVSYDFTIDSTDQTRPIQIAFDYKIVSGTFFAADGITAPLNDGTTSQNAGMSDLEVFIYDVTNSVLIPVSPQVLTSTSTTSAFFKGIFQTPSNSTSYRLILHTARSTAVAFTAQFDNFYVGPQILVQGAPVTDFASYSPTITGAGTPTNVNLLWRRVGDSYQIQGTFTTGTTTGVLASVSLPNSATLATQTITNTTANAGPMVGVYANEPTKQAGSIVTATGTSSSVVYFSNGWGGTQPTLTAANANSCWSSNTVVSVNFTVQIAGLSSTVQMSNDTDTRVVAAKYSASGTTNLTSGAQVVIVFGTKSIDTHSAMNASTGVLTVPVSGQYRIASSNIFTPASAPAAGNEIRLEVNKNGSVDTVIYKSQYQSTQQVPVGLSGSTIVNCVAGDTLSVGIWHNAANTAVSGSGNQATISIERISGPATIAASDTVSARYTTTTATALSGVAVQIPFTIKDYDTTNSMSGGIFTAPIAGKYLITTHFVATGSSAGTFYYRKNGSNFAQSSATASIYSGSEQLNLLAGDTIQIFADSGGTPTIATTAGANAITILRVGN